MELQMCVVYVIYIVLQLIVRGVHIFVRRWHLVIFTVCTAVILVDVLCALTIPVSSTHIIVYLHCLY